MHRPSRIRAGTIGASIAALALLVPSVVLAANVTVNAIPGKGWIQSPDNTAGMAAVIVKGPAGGLGKDSLELTTAANSDFTGVSRQVLGPLSDLTAGSWRTFVTGSTPSPASEAASLRFGMFRLGGTNEFTTMTAELANNGSATPGAWQQQSLSGSTMVWQTNQGGNFCIISAPCTFTDFKAQYPDAVLLGLTVAIGTGLPPETSWVDGVSLTVGGATDTWNFELAAAPTPKPTPKPTAKPGGGATIPPTDVASPITPSSSADGTALIVLGFLVSVAALAARRPLSRRNR